MKKISLLLVIVSVFMISCSESKLHSSLDPLPSWNNTPTKKKIIEFVQQVTAKNNSNFVPINERIAVFDNDGTLWCEQPLYFELQYSLDVAKELALENPLLQERLGIKALLAKDTKTLVEENNEGILDALEVSHTLAPNEFNIRVQSWLNTIHPRFNKKYAELTYKPMLELLDYLRDNNFKVYIVSGGTSNFIRNFSEELYNIPPEQVVGSLLEVEYVEDQDEMIVKKDLWLNNDGGVKAESIFQFIGRKPILAFGNSDGDLQMLKWTLSNTRPNIALLLHHTDAQREYAYDKDSSLGRLDKGLTDAQDKEWILVDMKNDFKKVFSFDK